MSLIKRGMINTGNFDTKSKRRTHKSTKSDTGRCYSRGAKNWNDRYGCVKARLPVKGG